MLLELVEEKAREEQGARMETDVDEESQTGPFGKIQKLLRGFSKAQLGDSCVGLANDFGKQEKGDVGGSKRKA